MFEKQFSKSELLSEFEFLIENQNLIFKQINSNKESIQSQYRHIAKILNKQLDSIEELIEFNIALDKLNAYIAMALLNDVTNHELELKYLTRLPVLFFRLHLNKLKILSSLLIIGKSCFIHTIPPELGLLNQLKRLSLEDCHLNILPKEIGLLHRLEYLNLNNNLFESLPEEIGQLAQLKECYLAHDPKLKKLPNSFWNLNKLEILNLHHNAIKEIPQQISNLSSLRNLNMNYNEVAMIPQEITKLSQLEEIHLRHNQIKRLQFDISKLVHLKLLDVKENDIEKISDDYKHLIH